MFKGHFFYKFVVIELAVCMLLFSSALAEINLEINQVVTGKVPIAIDANRSKSANHVTGLVAVMRKDLSYSEKIKVLTGLKESKKAEYILRVSEEKSPNRGSVFCMQMSTPFQKNMRKEAASFCLESSGDQVRQVAHQFSDKAHRHITGKANIFTHKIGYVKEIETAGSKKYQIISSDFDRHGEQLLLESESPIMSLSFSPDGKKLAYVSFEEGVSQIFIQDIGTGSRGSIAKFQGVNSAPSWSPDGKKMAMALSFSGVTKLYIMDIKQKVLKKLTSGKSIDTEPYWLKDGSGIVFSSNRTGSPQIHRYGFATKTIQQLTHHGQYNVAPQVSADGRFLVYLTKIDKRLQVVAQDLKTHELRYLGNGNFDDTPRSSPTGEMILYTTSGRGTKSMLAIVSMDGVIKVPMEEIGASLKYPTWSPISGCIQCDLAR